MTKDEIVRLAFEAGFPATKHPSGRHEIAGQSVSRFKKFADLVAEAERDKLSDWDRFLLRQALVVFQCIATQAYPRQFQTDTERCIKNIENRLEQDEP